MLSQPQKYWVCLVLSCNLYPVLYPKFEQILSFEKLHLMHDIGSAEQKTKTSRKFQCQI